MVSFRAREMRGGVRVSACNCLPDNFLEQNFTSWITEEITGNVNAIIDMGKPAHIGGELAARKLRYIDKVSHGSLES